MAKEHLLGKAAINILEIMSMMRELGTEKCFGQMVLYTKVSGNMVFKTEKEL
jgi:hypothetical protein